MKFKGLYYKRVKNSCQCNIPPKTGVNYFIANQNQERVMKLKQISGGLPSGVKIISTVMAVYGVATIFRVFTLFRTPEQLAMHLLASLTIMLILAIMILSGSILMSQKKKEGLYTILFYLGMFVTQKLIQIIITLTGQGALLMISQERANMLLIPAVAGTLIHLPLFFYLSSERITSIFRVVQRSRAIRNILLSSSAVSVLLTLIRIMVQSIQ